jgi:hypothetical protein
MFLFIIYKNNLEIILNNYNSTYRSGLNNGIFLIIKFKHMNHSFHMFVFLYQIHK